jgi:hypothetical protein
MNVSAIVVYAYITSKCINSYFLLNTEKCSKLKNIDYFVSFHLWYAINIHDRPNISNSDRWYSVIKQPVKWPENSVLGSCILFHAFFSEVWGYFGIFGADNYSVWYCQWLNSLFIAWYERHQQMYWIWSPGQPARSNPIAWWFVERLMILHRTKLIANQVVNDGGCLMGCCTMLSGRKLLTFQRCLLLLSIRRSPYGM